MSPAREICRSEFGAGEELVGNVEEVEEGAVDEAGVAAIRKNDDVAVTSEIASVEVRVT